MEKVFYSKSLRNAPDVPDVFKIRKLGLFGQQVADDKIDFSWTVEDSMREKGITDDVKLVSV